MARYKAIDTSSRFLAVDPEKQLLPGSFEHDLGEKSRQKAERLSREAAELRQWLAEHRRTCIWQSAAQQAFGSIHVTRAAEG